MSIKDWIYRAIACGMSTFQTYTAVVAPFTAMIQRPIHLAFGLPLVFLGKPSGDGILHKALDYLLAAVGIVVGLYWVFNQMELMSRAGSATQMDIVISALAVLVILEGTRRIMGPALSLIALAFMAYAYFGPYMPSFFGHRGYSLERILFYCYTYPEAIFGVPLGVSATYIYMFVMLACVMNRTGMGDVFIRLAFAATGRFVGGPGKAAVLGSALFGCVSGASSANVVATGTFTIPLMKKAGFPGAFAGGVEAAASTGGQIMPPMMGAAAFIIADVLGVSYFTVCVSAAIPALLYFLSVGSVIHFECLRLGLGRSMEQTESVLSVLKKDGYQLLPLVALVAMLAMDLSPLRAGAVSVALTIAINLLFGKNKLDFKGFVKVFEESATRSLEVVMSTSCAGIIVGMVSLTGIGLKFSNAIISLSGSHLSLVLVMSMIASIILGMGLPTAACYIILSVITAPIVVKMGVMPMAAHLFIFYFGIMSTITPPVALSSYIAASLADANPMRTGIKAVQLALAGFIVPYMFVYNPGLIASGSFLYIMVCLVTSCLGIIALSAATVGYFCIRMHWIERIVFVVAAVCLIGDNTLLNVASLVVMGAVFLLRREKKPVAASDTESGA